MGLAALSPQQIVLRVVRRARSSHRPWVRSLFALARRLYRLVGRLLPFLHLGWEAQLNRVYWDGDALAVHGWGYTRGTGIAGTPTIEVWLHRRWSRRRVAARVTPVVDPDVRGAARRAEFDYANTAFDAVWDADALAQLSSRRTGRWQVRVAVGGGGRRSWGRVQRVSPFGSAAVMQLRRGDDGVLVGPRWHDRLGLTVVRQEPGARATSVEVDGRRLTVTLDRVVTSARLVSLTQDVADLEVAVEGDVSVLRGEVPPRGPSLEPETGRLLPASWTLEVDPGRRPAAVHLDDAAWRHAPDTASPLLLRADSTLRLEVVDVPVHVEVDEVRVEDDTVVHVAGRVAGAADGLRLVLQGSRSQVPVVVDDVADGRFVAHATLRVTAWGGPSLPPPRGAYSLLALVGDEPVPTFVDRALTPTFPTVLPSASYRLRVELDRRDQLRLQVGRPRTPEEYGSFHQGRLQHAFHTRKLEPRDAVYLESFFGRNATCNPRAIDREIARRHPVLPRYWGVDDLSIAVPEGAIPVVVGSAEWWEARARSRWIVTNEWLGVRFRKRSFQTVLQTWHGSMYKKIGLDRENMSGRHYRVLREERAKWDMFIAQNAPSTAIIESAYEVAHDDIIEVGYPRNDELHGVDDARRAEIRARLGVPDGVRLVMYAPTWRLPSGEGEEDFLDLGSLTEALGPEWMLLLRGHVRTLARSDAVTHHGVIDVGTYPQVSELFMVADVLITDYSSMMFDYSVTGKPIIFFAPDIDQYSDDSVRGAYFDLEATAPGPVVRHQHEVTALLTEGTGWHADFAERYAAWTALHNHLDDGGAASRAVDALFRRDAPRG